jgi:hypothetical protein
MAPIARYDLDGQRARLGLRYAPRMARSRSEPKVSKAAAWTLPDDLYDYAQPPQHPNGQPPVDPVADWRVIDDWPARVPITPDELDVFEAWFGDIIDEIFAPRA